MINRWRVYVNEHPTTQTKEKMDSELKNFVLNPDVPCTGNYHRRIYSDFYGVALSEDDLIHHINGNHNDNRIENLIKVTAKQHAALHAAMNKR
jgi:hypothetical protein